MIDRVSLRRDSVETVEAVLVGLEETTDQCWHRVSCEAKVVNDSDTSLFVEKLSHKFDQLEEVHWNTDKHAKGKDPKPCFVLIKLISKVVVCLPIKLKQNLHHISYPANAN